MSSVISPVLRLANGAKVVKVAIAIPSGSSVGTAKPTGLDFVEEVLSAYIVGTGETAAAGFASDLFINAPNTVGASVNATSSGNITVEALVAGY